MKAYDFLSEFKNNEYSIDDFKYIIRNILNIINNIEKEFEQLKQENKEIKQAIFNITGKSI